MRTLKISHATLIGVTNQVQEFKVATQNGEAPIEWKKQLGLDALLDQILNCKVLGNTAAAPQPGHPNGDKERLQVKKLTAMLLVLCVKSSTEWTRRKLTAKELAKTFDVPAWLVQNLTEEVLGEFFGGKTNHFVQVVWLHYLSHPRSIRKSRGSAARSLGSRP